jgi:predicted hydrocarbon binding protein
MGERNKDVMVYRFDPKRKYFLVSLHLENKPGELGNLANLLGIRGINILEGFFGGIGNGLKANVSFFLESRNEKMDEDWLKDFLKSSVGVSDVEVKTAVEGFLSDSLNFPITWNTGDRAVLMRVEGLRAMLDAVRSADPVGGEASAYAQGFSYGDAAWRNLFGTHRPKTREGFAEMLKIYVATGWGKIEIAEFNPGKTTARVKLSEGFECVGLSTGKPESHFIRGHLAGAFSAYFGREVRAVETKCLSKGDPHCEFEFSP